MKKYKVILACLYADFGQDGNMLPDFSNCSWEYENVYKEWKTLADEGLVDLEYFWLDKQSDEERERLVSLAKDADFIYQVPVTHALGIHLPTAQKIIEGGTPIVSFHPDLHMRYQHPAGDRFVHSRVTEGYDTHTVSPAKHMMKQLADNGVKAYHMPFGIPASCTSINREKHYDVTFVGQQHGIRERIVSQLRSAGVKVETWGHFWPDHPDHHCRPDVSEMVQVFNRSKINLNFRWCSRSPSYGQIKGRDFELLGCGEFMLATKHFECEDLYELYTPGVDFVECDLADMPEQIEYWLKNDTLREEICANAYKKRHNNLWTTRLKKFLGDWEDLK